MGMRDYNVYDAIDNEQEISDAHHLGETCDSETIKRLHEYGEEISYHLTDEEKIAKDAVAKAYWWMRVHSYPKDRDLPREQHPEYDCTIEEQVALALGRLESISPALKAIATRAICQVSLPETEVAQAA